MKKGIFCVLVCMLMIIITVVPISGTIFVKESSQLLIKGNVQYDETEKIFNDLKLKLDKVTTKQEALALIKEVIVELNECGLLPKGMSVRQAQRLVTTGFLKSGLLKSYQRINENNTGNYNCLVVGIANETFFRPFPALIFDIPIINYLVWESNLSDILNPLAFFYALRSLQPFKFGPYAYVGVRYKLIENGNVTYDITHTSSGWVWTLGLNGVKKWNGTYYGGLYTKYKKFVNNNYSSFEIWDPVGIRGFVGINFFNFISFGSQSKLPSFYIGFAREVNFTYSPPWT